MHPILFETPQEALLEAIEGGVPITELNIGSMAHSTGKTMVNNVISMDKDDVATFESYVISELNSMSVKCQTILKKICLNSLRKHMSNNFIY